MANYNENLIKFGWLNYGEMLSAIEENKLNAYDICFTKDTHQQFIISSDLKPIPIKSRVRIYGSTEEAIDDIRASVLSYAGEIISVRDGDKFIAYIVNQLPNGEFYISPVCTDGMIDYDEIRNVPIKNISGTLEEPVEVMSLEDGNYNVSGYFVLPDNTTVHSIVGNIVVVESVNLSTKHIKRINSQNITDYEITLDRISVKKYITDNYLESKGYTTTDYVDSALAALDYVSRKELEDYVAETCTLLIRHLIDDELNLRYSSVDDIRSLF